MNPFCSLRCLAAAIACLVAPHGDFTALMAPIHEHVYSLRSKLPGE